MRVAAFFLFFFFNDTATTEIYTLYLHDALPIYDLVVVLLPDAGEIYLSKMYSDEWMRQNQFLGRSLPRNWFCLIHSSRSEEHTSELQSRSDLVCRLLLEKKKNHEH